MKQVLRNQDAGIGEFREMAFTQRANECLAEITKIGHCAKKRFARNPFMHMLKGLERLGWRNRTQRDTFFRPLVLKRIEWLVSTYILMWPQMWVYSQLFPKYHIWGKRIKTRKKSTRELPTPPWLLLVAVYKVAPRWLMGSIICSFKDSDTNTKSHSYLPAALANWAGPDWPEVGECDAHLWERTKGGSGELQTCQSDLGATEGDGADHVLWHHAAHTG